MASFLVDTHVLFWWYLGSAKLNKAQARMLRQGEGRDGSIGVSPMSLWEIAFLVSRSRIKIPEAIETWLDQIEGDPRIEVLPITAGVAADAGRLGPNFPADPIDRIITATARIYKLKLLTSDEAIRDSGKVEVV